MPLHRIVAVCFALTFLAAGFGLDGPVCQAQNAPTKYEIKSVITAIDAAGKATTLTAPTVIVQEASPGSVEVKVGNDTYRIDTLVKRINGVLTAKTTLRYTRKGVPGTLPTLEQNIGDRAEVSANGIGLVVTAKAAKG